MGTVCFNIRDVKACTREEACSFTTKANHKETERKSNGSRGGGGGADDFQMLVCTDLHSPRRVKNWLGGDMTSVEITKKAPLC